MLERKKERKKEGKKERKKDSRKRFKKKKYVHHKSDIRLILQL